MSDGMTKIEGVVVEPLGVIDDDRGKVMHMMRSDSPLFDRFGEIYFSLVYHGIVKAWKLHKEMTQHYAVPIGNIRLVIYDDRKGSSTRGNLRIMDIGEDNYCLVKIPPGVWYGFKGISDDSAIIANITDMPFNPNELIEADSINSSFPYTW